MGRCPPTLSKQVSICRILSFVSAFEIGNAIAALLEPREHAADKIDVSANRAMSKLPYQIDFVLAVRRVILPKHLMEPHSGLYEHVRSLPGIPW
jgi:hypothetical protein